MAAAVDFMAAAMAAVADTAAAIDDPLSAGVI
jgi:hypothetical protein